jgi:hypothetical protein
MKKLVGFLFLLTSLTGMAQVDTSYIYNAATPFGSLDLRIYRSSTRYHYLQENKTFSYRESSPGVKSNTYTDMTNWDSSPYAEGNLREKNGVNDYFIMNYRMLFPSGYDPNYAAGYPLIVMMHGLGERGNCWDANCYWGDITYNPNTNSPAAPTNSDHPLLNNDMNLAHGGSPHLTARNLAAGKLPDDPTLDPRAFPGFVLFPQNFNGWSTSQVQDVIRIVRLAVKKYKIDPDRIYIHGLSNGGAAVYEAIKRAPWLFAAALPMSAVSDGSIQSKNVTHTVAHIPVWTFQGGQDLAPKPSKTEGYVKKFLEAGMDIKYTLYKNLGHGTWNTAYAEPNFFTYMLTKNKANIHVFFGKNAICAGSTEGSKLGLAAGFRAYQWEKDGIVIAGATSNEYIATEPGVYRARFSRKPNPAEADWNQWSAPVTIHLSDPPKPEVNVVGTQYMRGPDSDIYYNTVYLKSDSTWGKYYWYKNGVLFDVNYTSFDDTVSTLRLYYGSSSGNGKFTLIARGTDGCLTPPSDTTNLYFGNSGPLMPTGNTPTNFAGTTISNNTIDLTWNDISSIETGYEIWRRKPGGIFYLAGTTEPNATYFRDTRLEPSVSYDYKVRAVGYNSRSNYAPNNSKTINLIVTTSADTTPPSDPANLVVTGNTLNSISLQWTGSTDDTGIRYYTITYGGSSVNTPTNATTYTLTGLPSNTAYNIEVRAIDLGGNPSVSTTSAVGTTYVTGLAYTHSTGAWTDLDQITNWNTPEFTGTVSSFSIAPRTQDDFFNFEFTGLLYINWGGTYQFRLTSDDGSRLALNNVVIVDHDGIHGGSTMTSGNQTLSTGAHGINLKYFEYAGGQSLTVQYRGPDTFGFWTTIPASALKSGAAPPVVGASVEGATVVTELGNGDDMITVDVFPNPSTQDKLYVKVESVVDGPVDVKMVDMMGRPYFRNTFSKEEIRVGAKITPTSRLLHGMYVIVVNQGKTTKKHKVIITE